MIKKLKTMFAKKADNNDYYWAGPGSNPLKEHGIKDMSEYKKPRAYSN